MLSNFNIQIWKNDIPGLLQILQGSDRFPGSIATLAGLDLLGVLEPLEQVDPVTYLSLVGVASLQGPVAPWNVWNSEFVKEVCNRAVTLFFLQKNGCLSANQTAIREAVTVFSRLPSLRRLQATPPLQTSLISTECHSFWNLHRRCIDLPIQK